MRVTELFNISRQTKKTKRYGLFILVITGLLSVLIAAITVYGQYTGTYLVSITRDAQKKGIAISTTRDFKEAKYDIKIEPLEEVEDIMESWIDKETAIKTDGQTFPSDYKYIAFTFYLKNTGTETININYQIKVIDDYKNLGKAAVFKIIEFEEVGNDFIQTSEKNYSKQFVENTDTIASVDIPRFRAGEVRKFTYFVWFEGEYSTPEMMGGAIKFEWVFGITSAIDGEEELEK